ncbi:MAG: TrbI/VirB10 family protein [Proteobacteria bacterium]|jgi:type IV secretion system protein VirB10|nr:TrbI/VirB10 family protein [Pseudomonadota bacterium]
MTDTQTGYIPPESAPPIDLRAPMPRVKRVNRIAIATVIAGLGVLVAFALIAALRQPEKAATPAKSNTQLVLQADALSDLPTDYAAAAAQRRRDVPKLGEPIGGEFGAAQLDVQNEAKARSTTAAGDPVGKLLADMTLARLKRRAAARDAKPDFGDHPSGAAPLVASTAERAAPSASASDAASRSMRDQDNRQDDKREFTRSRHTGDSVLDQAVLTPANTIYLGAGTVIPAVLLTGINSDLPGMITAQVAEPVYDTVTGKHVLIPQGSTLIGEYDSRITFGQERVLFVWTRVRFPNGSSLNLEGMPGTDLSGFAGVSDQVDNHWWRLAKGVVLGSILGAAAQQSYGGGLSAANPSLGQLAAAGAAQNINNAGQQIVQKNLQVQPTLVIRPGQRVAVFVTKDIALPPYRG